MACNLSVPACSVGRGGGRGQMRRGGGGTRAVAAPCPPSHASAPLPSRPLACQGGPGRHDRAQEGQLCGQPQHHPALRADGQVHRQPHMDHHARRQGDCGHAEVRGRAGRTGAARPPARSPHGRTHAASPLNPPACLHACLPRGFDVFVNMVLEDVTEYELTAEGKRVRGVHGVARGHPRSPCAPPPALATHHDAHRPTPRKRTWTTSCSTATTLRCWSLAASQTTRERLAHAAAAAAHTTTSSTARFSPPTPPPLPTHTTPSTASLAAHLLPPACSTPCCSAPHCIACYSRPPPLPQACKQTNTNRHTASPGWGERRGRNRRAGRIDAGEQ